MSKGSLIAGCRTAALAGLLGASLWSCKKDEPPPPLPAAPVAAEPAAAEAPLQLVPEDAGKPPEPADSKPKATGAKASSGLGACCKALRQNAASAPPPNDGYMKYAADLCDTMAKSGQGKDTIVGAVRTALKGAGLPADCK